MKRIALAGLTALALVLSSAPPAASQGKFGEQAPDFPPGVFTDGGKYSLEDCRGKLVVLFFYESTCPTCKKTIPERNKVAQSYKDKPVKFIAIGASDSLAESKAYIKETGLAMPVFADNLGIMESRYGFVISLKNIYQFRVVGPDGKVIGYDMNPATIDKALSASKVEWRYKGQGYDAKLDLILDQLEWGQYAQGMKLLAPLRKSPTKALAESASKLYDAVRDDGKVWVAEAEKEAMTDPVKAYDLYSKVAAVFAGDELGKSVAEPLKRLAAEKAVQQELAARKVMAQTETQVLQMPPAQKKQAAQLYLGIAKKFAGTPTGERAAALAKELGG